MEKKETFGFRKSRVSKTLCGAILGTAAFVAVSGNKVLAEETITSSPVDTAVVNSETGNPATNLPEKQEDPTTEATNSQNQAGQAQGSMPIDVSTSELDQAVEEAKAAGITVVEDETVDKGTVTTAEEAAQKEAEIKDDYASQAEAIKETTDQYKADVAANQAETDRITAENAAKKAQYEQDRKAYLEEVDRITAENAAKKADYEAKLAQYQADLAAIQQANSDAQAAYQAALAAYQTELARVQAANAAAKAAYEAAVAANNAKNAEIAAENEAIKQRNAAAKADYEAKLAQYQADLAQYQADLAAYPAKLKAYQDEQAAIAAALAELEKHKNEDGYLSEPSAQNLVYKLEPNATLDVETTGDFISANAVDLAMQKTSWYKNKYLYLHLVDVDDLEGSSAISSSAEIFGTIGKYAGWSSNANSSNSSSSWASVLLDRGETATATYTNLENSYYNGKKISKVVYKYSIDPSSDYRNDKVWLAMYTDPTVGAFASSYDGAYEDSSIFIKTEFTFYDEDGNPIEFEDALMSVASLNRDSSKIELVKDYTGEFVKISGSSVGESNGMIYATESENLRKGEGGARFSSYNYQGEIGWDTADAVNSWYGAGALKLTGPTNTITVGASSSGRILGGATTTQSPSIWFSINANIRATNVPVVTLEEPVAPTPPTEPTPPTYEVEQPLEPAPVEPTYEVEPTPPTPPTEQPEPVAPTPPTYEEEPTPPTEPNSDPLPDPVPVPTLHFRYFRLAVQPQVNKEIKNNEDNNIDRTLVAKQSTVKFQLKTDPLPAGRDETLSFVLVDPLPQGYQIALEATKTASPGFDVSFDEATNTVTFTATAETLALYNTDLTQPIITIYPTIIGQVLNDGATYTNNFTLTVNDAYGIKSNIVRVTTPGKPDDPDNPDNNYITPHKVNKNEAGVVIDGKSVLAGSTNFYELTWDLNQYKGNLSGPEAIQRGFFYIDDYPEEAVTLRPELIKIIDANGDEVTGLSVADYASLDVAPDAVKEVLAKANITPKGAFQMFTADDPESFHATYVLNGLNITIINPMTVKAEMGQTGGSYENKAYQIDFGNGYESNVVVNNVPKITPEKDVTITMDPADMTDYDGQTIALNQVFNYRLIGGIIPADHSEELFDYSFSDDYDQTGDQYTGQYKAFAKGEIKLKDGSIIAAYTDLSQYTEAEIDDVNGFIVIRFKEDFLRSVSVDSAFQAEVYLQMRRIAVGTFENTYLNTVNGVTYSSNTVRTRTPEDPTPDTPELPKSQDPSVPLKLTPKKLAYQAVLPQTGSADHNYLPLLGLVSLAAAFSLFSLKRKDY